MQEEVSERGAKGESIRRVLNTSVQPKDIASTMWKGGR